MLRCPKAARSLFIKIEFEYFLSGTLAYPAALGASGCIDDMPVSSFFEPPW